MNFYTTPSFDDDKKILEKMETFSEDIDDSLAFVPEHEKLIGVSRRFNGFINFSGYGFLEGYFARGAEIHLSYVGLIPAIEGEEKIILNGEEYCSVDCCPCIFHERTYVCMFGKIKVSGLFEGNIKMDYFENDAPMGENKVVQLWE